MSFCLFVRAAEKSQTHKNQMIDATRILLFGLKNESGVMKACCWTPANVRCVPVRFFAWFIWRFAPRSPRFATPTVTVTGVMWHAAPGREYLTIIWRPRVRFDQQHLEWVKKNNLKTTGYNLFHSDLWKVNLVRVLYGPWAFQNLSFFRVWSSAQFPQKKNLGPFEVFPCFPCDKC